MTLLLVAIQWFSALPEWKREALLMGIQNVLQPERMSDPLTAEDRQIIRQFNREMSEWNAG
jgi:ubiquitin-protein ligase